MIAASLALVALVAGGLMGFSHYWIPIKLGRDLDPPWSYVVGVVFGILAPFGGWCLFYWLAIGPTMAWWLPVVALACVTAGAGYFVLQAYDTDKRRRESQRLRQLERDAQRGNER